MRHTRSWKSWASLAVALLVLAPASEAQGVLRFVAPVYKTKVGKAGTTYTPLKLAKGRFELTVQLLDGPAGALLHEETLGYTVRTDEASNPSDLELTVASKVAGQVGVVLGGDPAAPLPPDLVTNDVWFATQVTLFNKKGVATTYEVSPAQPLGLSGYTRGLDLAPRSLDVEQDARVGSLTVPTGAVAGFVLTSDADGLASWQPAAEVPLNAIGTDEVVDESLTSDDLGPDSVSTDEIAAGAVGSAELADGAVGSAKIAANAVGAAQIATGAVGSAEIAANAVGAAEIATGAVGSAEIADGSVGSAEIATGAVDSAEIANDAVGSDELAAGAVTATKLGTAAVTFQALAANSVGGDQLISGSVTSSKIAVGAVGSAAISSGAVDTGELANEAVTTTKLADDAVTTDKLAAGAVTTGALASNAVTSSKILNATITASDIATGAIGTPQIVDGAVSGAKLGAGAVTSDKIANGTITSADIGSNAVGDSEIANDAVDTNEILDFGLEGEDISTYDGQIYHGQDPGVVGNVEWMRIEVGALAGLSTADVLDMHVPDGASTQVQFIELNRGNDTEFRLDTDGDAFADGSWNGGGADYADLVRVLPRAADVEPGDVLVLAPDAVPAVALATTARSPLVAGVYSTRPAFVGWGGREPDLPDPEQAFLAVPDTRVERIPLELRDAATLFDEVPLALVGIVPCKVSAENGPIRTGDLLVTSWTPGHAMRDDAPRPGTILGKALGELTHGTGVIQVLITLQ